MLRPKLGRLWGSSNSVIRRDPGTEKYLEGWLPEIPTFQVLNFLQWKTDATIQALAERGVLEWGSDVSYKKGAAAWNESDGYVYVATMDGPTEKPSSSSTQWVSSAIQLSRASYDKTLSDIKAHIADVTGNPHKLTPARLNTYTVAQIDALVAQYRAEVYAHTQDTNNPHKLTALIVGAVPSTGGTYTGTVTMGTGQLLLSDDGSKLVKADSNGIGLYNSSGSVGVDSSGKGYVKYSSGNTGEIVTSQTFTNFKYTVEQNYTSPSPIFAMPFIRDINIYTGGGTCVSTFEPSYDAAGRLTMPQQTGVGHNLRLSDSLLSGSVNVTLSVDFVSYSPGSSDSIAYNIGVGSSGNQFGRLRFTASGKVFASSDNVTIASKVLSDGNPHRAVLRRSSSKLALFIDGILVSEVSTSNRGLSSSNTLIETSASTSSGQMLPVNICNFRLWDSLLTDSQISAL